MLNVFTGRSSVNTEKFIFEKIKGSGRTLLLVPDQFTLQAEREAFRYTGAEGFIDLDIISMNRLGFRVLAETGGARRARIDKYGRHMLTAGITAELNSELQAFPNLWRRTSFIEMVNNFIIDLKQYNVTPDMLETIIAAMPSNSLLFRKLSDILKIYRGYEERVAGKYLDGEDYIEFFLPKLAQADIVLSNTIWIYGFDSFTPKNYQILEQLITLTDVNIALTFDEGCVDEDVFAITGGVIQKLRQLAGKNGVELVWEKVAGDEYARPREFPALEAVEGNLFAVPPRRCHDSRGVMLVNAANPYLEAEAAAAYILELVREKGLYYKDMLIMCNDLEGRGSVIKRVFREFGIDVFLDKKKSIMHSTAVVFIISLLELVTKGYRTEDMLRLLKSGFIDIENDCIEKIENYAVAYRIRYTGWKKTFSKGLEQYGIEGLEQLEDIRRSIMNILLPFEKNYKAAKNVKEKIRTLYLFLRDDIMMPDKLLESIKAAEAAGNGEAAAETAQVWNEITGIFDQLVELAGQESFLTENLPDIIRAGFEEIQIGVLPSSEDSLIVGTMQRTRTGDIKALIVMGANEGILPSAAAGEGILNEDEKNRLLQEGIELCRLEDVRVAEERLGIYKAFAKPSHYLWVSYAAGDVMGKETKPSAIVSSLNDIFKEKNGDKGILRSVRAEETIAAGDNAVKHLTEQLRRSNTGGEMSQEWLAVAEWLRVNRPEKLRAIGKYMWGEPDSLQLDSRLAGGLYRYEDMADIVLSPSRLEKYSRCPFAHFILYGLKPEEKRVFEIAGREIGDIYHVCMMEFSKALTKPGIAITDSESPWMTITARECRELVNGIVDGETGNYKEGVFHMGNEENYRTERIKEVCGQVADVLVSHVKAGRIMEIAFEEQFGRADYKPLPPIEVELEDQKVYIEGKIDRADTLAGGEVKIIDYKSGNEKFNLDEVKSGWRLQLMLYLEAAQTAKAGGSDGGDGGGGSDGGSAAGSIGDGDENGRTGEKRQPAGVFYFHIDEPAVELDAVPGRDSGSGGKSETDTGNDGETGTGNGSDERVESGIRKLFKLDGVMIDDDTIIREIGGSFSGISDIIPVRLTKEGIYKGTSEGRLLSREQFAQLQTAVDEIVGDLCESLTRGDISVKPKKTKTATACDYCQYSSICRIKIRH